LKATLVLFKHSISVAPSEKWPHLLAAFRILLAVPRRAGQRLRPLVLLRPLQLEQPPWLLRTQQLERQPRTALAASEAVEVVPEGEAVEVVAKEEVGGSGGPVGEGRNPPLGAAARRQLNGAFGLERKMPFFSLRCQYRVFCFEDNFFRNATA